MFKKLLQAAVITVILSVIAGNGSSGIIRISMLSGPQDAVPAKPQPIQLPTW